RFDLRALHTRLLVAAANCGPLPQRAIRTAEVHC
ncbi:IS1595 family transposase, partial [Thauera aromatica]|nr:IS1595 family transposase [Thauera aromatica]